MYSIKLLAVTALALSPTAMADCYGGGPDGINKAWAYNNVKGICDAYMLGYYVHGQQRHGCLTDGPNQWYFTVKLRDDVDDRSINEAECISGLQKQITECDKGGNTQYGHWIYTSDANHGTCTDVDYLNDHPELVQGSPPAIKGRSFIA